MLRCIVIGMGIGVVTELVARALRLWRYQHLQTPLLNIVLVFGLIMGGLTSIVRPLGLLVVMGIAFAVGLLYEVANLRVLKWWEFPNERMAFISGHAAIVVVLALLWALVPAMIVSAQAVLPVATRGSAPVDARIELLNQRERQLTEKLQALLERTRAVETKLEEVRAAKARLLTRRAPQQPETSPSPPPAGAP